MRMMTLLIGVTLIAVLLLTPFAVATPLTEKNNEKFQSFSVVGTFNFARAYFGGDHYYYPSIDNVKKMVIEFNEQMLTYVITIGGNTYNLGTDFTYTGHATFTYFDPVFTLPAPYTMLYPTSSRGQYHAIIDYSYAFSTSTIQGTINMQCVVNEGGFYINSLSGTGDLQNIQIKAQVTGNIYDSTTYMITIFHDGLVAGWPE